MEYNKKLAKVSDAFRYYSKAFFYIGHMISRDKKFLDEKFIERIMLTVTQVNGCKICSQAHAKRALDIGMSNREISQMLSDKENEVSEKDSVAVLFATNYADKNGNPDKVAVDRLYKTYGRKNGKGIIAVCSIIMIGNTMGIAQDTFLKKFKRIKTGSSIFRELGVFLSFILFIPLYILIFILGLIINH